MTVREQHQRSLDHTGLNMIRIVIGSYFMAISLGLIKGIAPPVLFLSLTDPRTADLIGTILLFSVTTCFMVGIYLRLTSLMLAIFVMASSVAQNFVMPAHPLIEPFWRDLTLVCAVLLSYSSLKRSEMRNATLVWRRSMPKLSANEQVAPRRVSTSTAAKRNGQSGYVKSLKPLMQKRSRPDSDVTPLVPLAAPSKTPRLVATRAETEHGDEVENIFAAM